MNNPFEKKDHTVLIAGAVLGAVVAGAAAYLLLTEEGEELCGQLSARLEKLLRKEPGEATPEADEAQ